MNNYFNLTIITPEEEFFTGDVINLNCETTEGRIGILPNHCATIAALINTITKFEDVKNKKYKVSTSGGILKIKDNRVVLLCDFAKWDNSEKTTSL